jgi:hypothetical protein
VKNIKKLSGMQAASDIYILCSGPSADYLQSQFLNDKIVISVNASYKAYGTIDICDYIVMQDYNSELIEEAGSGLYDWPKLIIPEHAGGMKTAKSFVKLEEQLFPEFKEKRYNRLFYYKHQHNVGVNNKKLDWTNKEYLTITKCSTHTAMHLAAHLGAHNIILVGHDLGSIDGKLNYKDYKRYGSKDSYVKWMKNNENIGLDTVKRIRGAYGAYINIMSLNPFLSPNLDGHSYKFLG